MITTRLAVSGDAAFIQQMLYQALFVPPGAQPPPYELIYDPDLCIYFDNWGREGDLGLIAIVNGATPVGAAWLRYLNGEPHGYGYVADDIPELSIALLPEYRNQGIGSRLIREIFEVAAASCPSISLSVMAASPAKRLYERLGFTLFRSEGDSVVMIYYLKPETSEP